MAKKLSYGSSGAEVKKLQNALGSAGYEVEADGEFGTKTLSAVYDYQKKNGLTPDGVAGEKTMSALTVTPKKSLSSNSTATAKPKKSTSRPTYAPSDDVSRAQRDVESWQANKPAAYESAYSDEIDGLLQKILNREDFQYSMDADPLYQQYKDQYIQNGKLAMMDTVGNATALTGGYANSYALTAGSEAYQNYLNALSDKVPELRESAYRQYREEGDALLEDVSLLRTLDGDAFEKYRQAISAYYQDGDFLLDRLTAMSDAEYEAFLHEVDAWENDRDYAYRKAQDAQDQKNFQTEQAFKQEQAKRDQANKDRSYALAKSKAAASASRSSSSGSSSSSASGKVKIDSNAVMPKTYAQFVNRTGYAGILTEQEFSARSEYQKSYGSYQKYLASMYKRYGGQ